MSVVAGRQSLGARERQEDAFRVVQQDAQDPGADLLVLLADGMGGHVGGEVASKLTVEVFERQFIQTSRLPKPQPRLIEALEAANGAMRDRIAADPALAGMGTTLIAVFKIGNQMHWLSVGDSLLYLFRNGELRRLNADHSVHGELLELVRKGQITRQEADQHPRRNALRSAVTGERIELVDTGSIALKPRDLLLLASDGIETISEAQIAAILGQQDHAGPGSLGTGLLGAVEAEGNPKQDNTTVVVYRFDPSGAVRRQDSLILLPERKGLRLSPWHIVAGGVLAAGTIAFALSRGEAPAPPGGQATPASPSASNSDSPAVIIEQAPPTNPGIVTENREIPPLPQPEIGEGAVEPPVPEVVPAPPVATAPHGDGDGSDAPPAKVSGPPPPRPARPDSAVPGAPEAAAGQPGPEAAAPEDPSAPKPVGPVKLPAAPSDEG